MLGCLVHQAEPPSARNLACCPTCFFRAWSCSWLFCSSCLAWAAACMCCSDCSRVTCCFCCHRLSSIWSHTAISLQARPQLEQPWVPSLYSKDAGQGSACAGAWDQGPHTCFLLPPAVLAAPLCCCQLCAACYSLHKSMAVPLCTAWCSLHSSAAVPPRAVGGFGLPVTVLGPGLLETGLLAGAASFCPELLREEEQDSTQQRRSGTLNILRAPGLLPAVLRALCAMGHVLPAHHSRTAWGNTAL